MDTVHEIDGRKIARKVQARAEAKALLQKHQSPRGLMLLLSALILLGAAAGAGSWSDPGQLLAAIAGAGIALGFGASIVCYRLSKRLDALVKVLDLED